LLKVLGRRIDLSGAGTEAISRLRDRLLFPDSADALTSNWTVEIHELTAAVPAKISEAELVSGDYGTRHLRVDENEFWILENTSGVRLQLRVDSASIELYGLPFTGWIALESAVGEAIAVSGLLRLHASAMYKHGRTILFMGPSGRGKSTTLVRGLEAGYSAVAEDACWLDPIELRLFGFDRGLRMLPDTAELLKTAFPEAIGRPSRGGKTEFAFDQVGGNVDDVVLTDLVLLRRESSTETAWSELEKSHAVLSLYESIGIPHTGRAREFVSTALSGIVEGTTCRQLMLGSTPPAF
jgi:hypothetical protein